MDRVHQSTGGDRRRVSFAITARKALFWGTASFIALETLVGGVTDLVHGGAVLVTGTPVVDIVTGLGYPVYVLTILGMLKIPAAFVLLAPGWRRLKEWAYAGITFELLGAAASFVIHGHDFSGASTPLIFALVALASWALRPPDRRLSAQAIDQNECDPSLV